jgi:ABC-type nitrate/sulfonate/bicarbonate transport system permease component
MVTEYMIPIGRRNLHPIVVLCLLCVCFEYFCGRNKVGKVTRPTPAMIYANLQAGVPWGTKWYVTVMRC